MSRTRDKYLSMIATPSANECNLESYRSLVLISAATANLKLLYEE